MKLLLTIAFAVVGAWFFVGGIAGFVAPSDAVPSSGPELLVSAPANQLEDALSFLFVVVGYLAHRGEAIATGETVGRSATEKYVVNYVPSPLDPAKRVMRVDMARKA
ncbi:MAG: hypothetical protein U1F60_06660 [Planctomycetota bacterium]